MSGILALIALYLCIGSLIIFAFGNAAKRGDRCSDDALDLIDGDIRPADLLRVRDADASVSFHADWISQ